MRTCGKCVVCCVYPRMITPGFEKEPMVPCSRLKTLESQFTGQGCNNCTVYKDRPRGCVEYICQWLDGHGEETDRPDLVGIVFDTLPPSGRKNKIGNTIIARPLREGVEETVEGQALTERMSRSTGKPVLVLDFTERHLRSVVGRGA